MRVRARVSTAVCSVLVVVVASAVFLVCACLAASAASGLLTATACVLGGLCWLAARRRFGVRAMASEEDPSLLRLWRVEAVPRRAGRPPRRLNCWLRLVARQLLLLYPALIR